MSGHLTMHSPRKSSEMQERAGQQLRGAVLPPGREEVGQHRPLLLCLRRRSRSVRGGGRAGARPGRHQVLLGQGLAGRPHRAQARGVLLLRLPHCAHARGEMLPRLLRALASSRCDAATLTALRPRSRCAAATLATCSYATGKASLPAPPARRSQARRVPETRCCALHAVLLCCCAAVRCMRCCCAAVLLCLSCGAAQTAALHPLAVRCCSAL